MIQSPYGFSYKGLTKYFLNTLNIGDLNIKKILFVPIIFIISACSDSDESNEVDKLSSLDNPLLTLIFTGLIGAVIISLVVPFVWITPSYNQLIIMIGLALAGTLGHFLLILSFNFAEASKLAPFAYFEIVTNILIAYYFFGDFPDKWIWAGLIIIISSGVYITLREHFKHKAKNQPIVY